MKMNENEKILKKLGETVRKAREKARLTQVEVAASSGLSVGYYARIERGEVNPSYEKLQKVMKALKVKSLGLL